MSSERVTLVGTPIVRAPGKIFLVGEYAVLEGGVAVLAAVSRYALAQYTPGQQAGSRLVAEAVEHTRAEIGDMAKALPPGSVLVNTDEFRHGQNKVGLGSSAAAAVTAVAAVMEAAGLPIEDRRQQIFTLAHAAHNEAQGGVGSGADVAASVHGGVIEFQRSATASPSVQAIDLPPNLHLVVFWTRQPADTKTLVESVRAFSRRAPAVYQNIIDSLRASADRFMAELTAGHATAVVAAAGRYGRHMAELGKAAGVGIVTDPFVQASALARELGGDAKPSGAGGGDIGVAFFATPEAASLFARACLSQVDVLDVCLAREGVARRLSEVQPIDDRGPFHV